MACSRHIALAATILIFGAETSPGMAQSETSNPAPAQTSSLEDYLESLPALTAKGRAEQPSWATPMVTNSGRLEERIRFDSAFEHVGNGSNIVVVDGGKGLDLMVGETTEVQIALPPYIIKTTPSGKGQVSGFNDWQFLRVKQRLASGNAQNGDYIVSAYVAFQAPTGVQALSSGVYQVSPTLAAGKGFGPFVVQSAIGIAIPLAREQTLGTQVVTNVAFQYRLFRYFWPEIETNWTYYAGGVRSGKNQVFLTPGLVLSRFAVGNGMTVSFGVAYQYAVSPAFRPSPLLPAYNHGWLVSTRLNF